MALPSSIDGVELKEIHHLGIAVERLDDTVDLYRRLFGATVEHYEVLADQGVRTATVMLGSSRIELLEPTGPDTPVGRFLERRGPGMHHVAYLVDDVAGALRELQAAGAELIDETPRRGLFGLEVAFVHPSSVHGVLSEVVGDV